VGVQPARVREDPDRTASERVGLQAHDGPGSSERRPVGGQADDGDEPGSLGAHERVELGGPGEQLLARELVGRARGTRRDVRHADAEVEQVEVLVGSQTARGEAGGVQRRPEAVAGPGEVVADLGRAQRRVDPDEEDPQARSGQRPEDGPRCLGRPTCRRSTAR
jgi:hypothetical protein